MSNFDECETFRPLSYHERLAFPDATASAEIAYSTIYAAAWVLLENGRLELGFIHEGETFRWVKGSTRIAYAILRLLEEGDLTPMEISDKFNMQQES